MLRETGFPFARYNLRAEKRGRVTFFVEVGTPRFIIIITHAHVPLVTFIPPFLATTGRGGLSLRLAVCMYMYLCTCTNANWKRVYKMSIV